MLSSLILPISVADPEVTQGGGDFHKLNIGFQ